MSMNSNKTESVFWKLAKKTGLIEMSESSTVLSETQELLKDTKHFTESAFTIMEQICVLKEKKRKLKLAKINSSHQKRLSLFKRQYDGKEMGEISILSFFLRFLRTCFDGHRTPQYLDEGMSEIRNIKIELEFALHRNNIILHLLQTASKTKETLPIPIHLQETLITIIKDLVRVTTMKVQSVEYFKKLSVAYSDLSNILKGMFPLKQQVLRNISLYNSALYNLIEMEKEIDDLGVNVTTCAISFLGDMESCSMNL